MVSELKRTTFLEVVLHLSAGFQSAGSGNPPREYPWQIRESRCLQPNTPEQLKEAIGPTPKPAFISGGHSRPAELDHHQTTHFKEGKLQVSFL